jgi:hypothetical protein
MSLNENNRNVNAVLQNFYSRQGAKFSENHPPKFNSNEILIYKHQFPKLKKNSGFFEVFIDRDFTNSNDFFDKDGNYILKKSLLPEEFYYYDKNFNTDYVISRNEVFNVLPEVLYEGRTADPVLANLIRDFFMFNKNVNFFNPTLPIPEHLKRPHGVYFRAPGRKERQRERNFERDERLYELGLLNDLTNKQKRKEELLELKHKLQELNRANVEALAEAVFGNNGSAALVVGETEKATRVYSKYPKSGKRPSKTSKKTREHRENKRRENVRRKTARKAKANKRRHTNNNNERVGYGNYN